MAAQATGSVRNYRFGLELDAHTDLTVLNHRAAPNVAVESDSRIGARPLDWPERVTGVTRFGSAIQLTRHVRTCHAREAPLGERLAVAEACGFLPPQGIGMMAETWFEYVLCTLPEATAVAT